MNAAYDPESDPIVAGFRADQELEDAWYERLREEEERIASETKWCDACAEGIRAMGALGFEFGCDACYELNRRAEAS